MILSHCRSENKSFLKAALSEEAKIKRRREKTINLQMTMTSWCLEFATGILACTMRYFAPKDGRVVLLLLIVDVSLNFVVIPASYILSSEEIKERIIAQGWCKWFNSFHRSNRVEPAENGALEAPIALNPIPRPIPTISGDMEIHDNVVNNRVYRHYTNIIN